jgi:HECT-domain (ubiquitin-transferase)
VSSCESHSKNLNQITLVVSDGTNNIAVSQLLAFWTGAEAEPPLGFQTPALMMSDRQSSSAKPLLVDFYDDVGRLPYASTCSLCLWLPVNVNEDIFQSFLLRSLTECVGFGKV